MRLASKMLLQLAAQYIGQLTDIERGMSGRRCPGGPIRKGATLTARRLTE
jgi:hypothetical protein